MQITSLCNIEKPVQIKLPSMKTLVNDCSMSPPASDASSTSSLSPTGSVSSVKYNQMYYRGPHMQQKVQYLGQDIGRHMNNIRLSSQSPEFRPPFFNREQPNFDPYLTRRRRRTTDNQLRILTSFFQHSQFPSAKDRIELGRLTNMSPRAVQIWFQNRRQNTKRGLYKQDHTIDVAQALVGLGAEDTVPRIV